MSRFLSCSMAAALASGFLVGLSCLMPFDLLFNLAAGWTLFLYRVVPQVTVSPSGLATAAVCLVLLAFGMQQFLAWLYPQVRKAEETEPRWQWRWTFALLGVVVLMFVAGISATGITHQTSWLVTSPDPIMSHGSVREAANRMSSSNNLKQIALAAHNYADEHQKIFPPGGTCDARGTMLHGWQTALLPYIAQEALFREIRQDIPWNDSTNAPHFRTVIREYLQPAAKPQPKPDEFAPSHYAGNVRVLGGTSPWALEKITDGTSNTLLAGEAAGNYKPWGYPANWRDPALGINRSPDGFGGPFPNGANFSFADGSVRFLSDKIDPGVLKALSTPNGGEEIKADFDR